MLPFTGSIVTKPLIRNNRNEPDWQLPKFFGTMWHVGVEIERISGRKNIGSPTVVVTDLSFKHIKELCTRMLKQRKYVRFLGQGNQVGLDHDSPVGRMPQ